MSIDEEALRKAFAALQGRVAYLERALGLFASDEDLEGPRGDPVVKFAPRGWHGALQVGRRYSACEADFLEMLAESLAWSAGNPKAGKEKYAAYDRADAARARSWARRVRAGWAPPGHDSSTAAPDARSAGRPRPTPRPATPRPRGGRPGRPDPAPNGPQDVGFGGPMSDDDDGEPVEDFLAGLQ